MVTAAQNAANLKTAIRNVTARLGISDTRDLEHDAREQYRNQLALEILKYPQSFTEETLATARLELATPDHAAPSEGPGLLAFVDAFADEAKITLPSVGNKLLIGAVVVAVAYFAIKAWSAKGAPSPAPAA